MADKSKLTPDKWIISYTIVVMYDNFFLEALSRIRKKFYKLVFLKKDPEVDSRTSDYRWTE